MVWEPVCLLSEVPYAGIVKHRGPVVASPLCVCVCAGGGLPSFGANISPNRVSSVPIKIKRDIVRRGPRGVYRNLGSHI